LRVLVSYSGIRLFFVATSLLIVIEDLLSGWGWWSHIKFQILFVFIAN